MASITINNRPLTEAGSRSIETTKVVKIRRGEESAALALISHNGADDLAFKIGEDTYVASARAMDLRGVQLGNQVRFNGMTGTVVRFEDQINSVREAVATNLGGLTAASGVFGALAAIGGAATAGLKGALKFGAGTWIGILALTLGIVSLNASKTPNLDLLKMHGDEV